MKRLRTITIVIALACLAASVSAERKGLSKPSQRTFEVSPKKVYLGPKFTVGMVVGDVSTLISDLGGSTSDKIFYGFGFDGSYTLSPKVLVGGTVEYQWKTVMGDRDADDPIILTSFSAHGIYKLSGKSRSTFYLRPEVGSISAKLPYDRGDAGPSTFVRLGVGQWHATGPTTLARLELYYKHAFSKDEALFGFADYDVQGVGIDIAFAFGL